MSDLTRADFEAARKVAIELANTSNNVVSKVHKSDRFWPTDLCILCGHLRNAGKVISMVHEWHQMVSDGPFRHSAPSAIVGETAHRFALNYALAVYNAACDAIFDGVVNSSSTDLAWMEPHLDILKDADEKLKLHETMHPSLTSQKREEFEREVEAAKLPIQSAIDEGRLSWWNRPESYQLEVDDVLDHRDRIADQLNEFEPIDSQLLEADIRLESSKATLALEKATALANANDSADQPPRVAIPPNDFEAIQDERSGSKPDSKPDSDKKLLPEEGGIIELCRALSKVKDDDRSHGWMTDTARGFTREAKGNSPKAENNLRQAKRYGHLWRYKP